MIRVCHPICNQLRRYIRITKFFSEIMSCCFRYIIRLCMYLGGFGFSFRISNFTVHGIWSEMLLILIAEGIVCVIWSAVNCRTFYQCEYKNALSCAWEVIFGKNYWYPSNRKTRQISLSFFCNRFILKSPTVVAYLFSVGSVLIMGDISTTNVSILASYCYCVVVCRSHGRPLWAYLMRHDTDIPSHPNLYLDGINVIQGRGEYTNPEYEYEYFA